MADEKKVQCWEFLKCPTDRKEKCPAYPNQGRICFSVSGTLCRGELQGNYQAKKPECLAKCDFYKEVGQHI